MVTIKEIEIPGYERIIEAEDPGVGLKCIIALHDLTLGPAIGGVRMYPYSSHAEALEDAMRLARGMTYKSALAKTGFGGGKAVIIGDPKVDKTEHLLMAFGDVVESLKGDYITAEDISINPDDVLIVARRTDHVVGLPTDESSGDPSRFTSRGVYKGMKAVCEQMYRSTDLRGRSIAIQGLGNVGSKLADLLFWEGAKIIVCDTDEGKAHHFAKMYGAQTVAPEYFAETECDILSPCAMGGTFTKATIPNLRCKAIAGAANNQLGQPEDGVALHKQGILYAPDFIVNSGGIINVAAEFNPDGYNPNSARDRIDHLYDVLLEVFEKASLERISTSQAADEIAEKNLQQYREQRLKS